MFEASGHKMLIVGSGALACLFAARLSAAGVQVVMLGSWAQGLEALRSRGVILVEAQGGESAFPVQVIDAAQLASCQDFLMDYAIVLVKSWQTARAAGQLARCISPHGLVLTLQNGMGNREILAEVLGEARVALGVTTVGATLLGPGRVRQAGIGRISLGETPDLGEIPRWLEKAGFQLEFVADTGALLWGKLVVNAAINPLTALLGVPNGVLLERQPAYELMAAAAQEAASVARALGIALPHENPVEVVEGVARDTAKNRSSMLQDIQRGALTEIDAICGAIVQSGEQVGVPVPVNRCLWKLVQARQMESL